MLAARKSGYTSQDFAGWIFYYGACVTNLSCFCNKNGYKSTLRKIEPCEILGRVTLLYIALTWIFKFLEFGPETGAFLFSQKGRANMSKSQQSPWNWNQIRWKPFYFFFEWFLGGLYYHYHYHLPVLPESFLNVCGC